MGQVSDIKIQNKNKILRILFKKKLLSKKGIAQETGLALPLLTKLCSELLSENKIVMDEPIISNKIGRKEVPIHINANYKWIIGVKMDDYQTTLILSDLAMNIKYKIVIKTCMNPKVHCNQLIDEVKKIQNNFDQIDILCVAISIKGVTDGNISFRGIWREPFPLKEYLEVQIKLQIIIDNGVRTSARLEMFNSNQNDFMFLKYVNAGIGGAIVREGKILHGETHTIMNFGHIIIAKSGEYCPNCKRKGCLETEISFSKLIKIVQDQFVSLPILQTLEKNREDLNIVTLIEAEARGETFLVELFREVSTKFAICVINAKALSDVVKIKILGDLFESERFRGYFREALELYDRRDLFKDIEFLPSQNELLDTIALGINKYILNDE